MAVELDGVGVERGLEVPGGVEVGEERQETLQHVEDHLTVLGLRVAGDGIRAAQSHGLGDSSSIVIYVNVVIIIIIIIIIIINNIIIIMLMLELSLASAMVTVDSANWKGMKPRTSGVIIRSIRAWR